MVLLDWPPPDHLGIGRKRGNSCQRKHPAAMEQGISKRVSGKIFQGTGNWHADIRRRSHRASNQLTG
jgi:hypothetical protein